jgi:hypothetical protein
MSRSAWFIPILLVSSVAFAADEPGPRATPYQDRRDTPHYEYEIDYPAIDPKEKALRVALRDLAERAKHDFVATAPKDDDEDEHKYTMSMTFEEIARNPHLAIVELQGAEYTGGVHGNPYSRVLLYDRRGDRMIELADLFDDPDAACAALSAAAIKQLREDFAQEIAQSRSEMQTSGRTGVPFDRDEWIARGAAPSTENFHSVAPVLQGARFGSLSIRFDPYQVAPYSDGMPTVEVPVALVRKWLKPEFAADFD